MVDPKLEIDEYLELARYMGVSIEHILETHNHADHVAGHGKLGGHRGHRSTSAAKRGPSTSTSPSTTAGSSSWGTCS